MPLFVKVGGGDKCLQTLSDTLYELVAHDKLISGLYGKSGTTMDPNFFYRYIMHIVGRKPYDPCQIREAQAKLGFREKHFTQFMKLLGEALGMLSIKDEVICEILKVALTTRADLKGETMKEGVTYW